MTLRQRWVDHLAENRMTYQKHAAFAARHGVACLASGVALLIHAVFPCWHREAGRRARAALSEAFSAPESGRRIQ